MSFIFGMMKRQNVLINKNIVARVGMADNYFLRLRGLIGRKLDGCGLGGLWITPCSQIHTCFMAYPIDVVYASKDMKVIRVDPELKPWKCFPPVKGAKAVLELPAGGAAGIRPGDEVRLEA